jgi:hypothetical protein
MSHYLVAALAPSRPLEMASVVGNIVHLSRIMRLDYPTSWTNQRDLLAKDVQIYEHALKLVQGLAG